MVESRLVPRERCQVGSSQEGVRGVGAARGIPDVAPEAPSHPPNWQCAPVCRHCTPETAGNASGAPGGEAVGLLVDFRK